MTEFSSSRRVFLAAGGASLAVGILSRVGASAENDQAPSLFAKAPALKVSIAVPEHFGKRAVTVNTQPNNGNPNNDASRMLLPLPVVLENLSEKPLSLWQEWCSWGYFNLTFEITDANGKTTTIRKKQRGWDKNYPDFATLAPGDTLVRNVALSVDTWDGLPDLAAQRPQTATMRAVFQIEADEDTKKSGVWTGRVVSQVHTYELQ